MSAGGVSARRTELRVQAPSKTADHHQYEISDSSGAPLRELPWLSGADALDTWARRLRELTTEGR